MALFFMKASWLFDIAEQHGRGENARGSIKYLDASIDALWQKNFVSKILPISRMIIYRIST